ncbi:hypothetical protein JTE90_002161 [Oedothorax gibbosus]|uniref:Uncharacterized protein n=1 Tax=Oedothorax gibbosus TaxID=931172 RepID=A0AAV6V9M6_9ARAC|nr:hypothetical protein JTE90_002161 [Oedothorax gibbosus]
MKHILILNRSVWNTSPFLPPPSSLTATADYQRRPVSKLSKSADVQPKLIDASPKEKAPKSSVRCWHKIKSMFTKVKNSLNFTNVFTHLISQKPVISGQRSPRRQVMQP